MCDETATAEDTDSRPAPGAGHSSLEALLTRLEASGESGAVGYEILRRRLVGFFRLHFAWRADELADIALERLARRLQEGTEVDHVAAYALGIARHVAMETQAKEQRQRLSRLPIANWHCCWLNLHPPNNPKTNLLHDANVTVDF